MERSFLARAAAEVLKFCLFVALFCLLAETLFAVFIRAFSLSFGTITAVNWVIQAISCLLGGVLFIRRERALFKGLAAGFLAVLFTMLVFGMVGGFYLNGFFPLKLLMGALFGGAGGLLGVKVRKE